MTKRAPFQPNPIRAPGPPCRFLRMQSAFRLGPTEYDETTRFWCVRALDNCGPDGTAVHAAWCQAGRSCYSAPPTRV